MYKIIGGDGKEYGPITADQIRQWQKEGRLNSTSRIMDTDKGQWTTLGELPEFAGMADASAGAASPPPSMMPPDVPPREDPEAFAQAVIARDYTLDIGTLVSRSWTMYKTDFGGVFAPALIAMIIMNAPQIFGVIPYIGGMISGIIGMIISGPMAGGLYYYYLRKKRGEAPQIGDIFDGFKIAPMPLILTAVVSGLLTTLGIFMCIIPGIYLGVAWMFASLLVIDKKLDFWDAMEVSRKVVTKHWFLVFLVSLVGSLLAASGIIACCIGILFTMPLYFLMITHAYEDIFGERKG